MSAEYCVTVQCPCCDGDMWVDVELSPAEGPGEHGIIYDYDTPQGHTGCGLFTLAEMAILRGQIKDAALEAHEEWEASIR